VGTTGWAVSDGPVCPIEPGMWSSVTTSFNKKGVVWGWVFRKGRVGVDDRPSCQEKWGGGEHMGYIFNRLQGTWEMETWEIGCGETKGGGWGGLIERRPRVGGWCAGAD